MAYSQRLDRCHLSPAQLQTQWRAPAVWSREELLSQSLPILKITKGAATLRVEVASCRPVMLRHHAFYFSSKFGLFSHNWFFFPTLLTCFPDPF